MKHCQLVKLPDVLCIQLKRFRHEGLRQYNAKVGTAVKFPLDDLDMAPYCSEEVLGDSEQETKYQLISFISHFGSSIDCECGVPRK